MELSQYLNIEHIILRPECLDPTYIPETLPHRENQLKTLIGIFQPLLKRNIDYTARVIITGQFGVGKTVLANYFRLKFQTAANSLSVPLTSIYINCMQSRTPYSMVQKIARKLALYIPGRGLSYQEIMDSIKEAINKTPKKVLLVLDESDSLLRYNNQDIMYDLIRFNEELERSCLSVIMIARNTSIVDLEPRISGLINREIILNPYTADQLFDILSDRVSKALRKGAISPRVVRMISVISSERGDARYAIRLLQTAAEIASFKGSGSITPEHVRFAVEAVDPKLAELNIDNLSCSEKLVLLGIVRSLIRSGDPTVKMGDVKKEYAAVCEEFEVEPLKHTHLWRKIRELSSLGIVDIYVSGLKMGGRSTLLGINDISIKKLELYLLQSLREGDDRPS